APATGCLIRWNCPIRRSPLDQPDSWLPASTAALQLLPRKRAAIIVRSAANYNKMQCMQGSSLAHQQLVQARQLVPQARGLLELEIAGMFVHLRLDAPHFRGQRRRIVCKYGCPPGTPAFALVRHASGTPARLRAARGIHDVQNALADAPRFYAMLQIELGLDAAPLQRRFDGPLHGTGDPVGIEDGLAV